ncbi:MAG: 3-oxoacyl-[acyl-carrier-protein] synthase III C-terminal domain-containing protein [Chloroflexota bacterium]
MDEKSAAGDPVSGAMSFFQRPGVERTTIPVGGGIPLGIERVSNPELGIGGAYGTWGPAYDNHALPSLIEGRLGEPLKDDDIVNLAELGFVSRHHTPDLSAEEHVELELEVGARLLREAAETNSWDPSQVEGVLVGVSGPVMDDFVPRIAERAGIPGSALKVSIHKACDGSMGGLHLALNPRLATAGQTNIAEELHGKKVLVAAIEGLSRVINRARDKYALQLFGNGAGAIGLIPGTTMRFLAGKTHEAFDEEGLLQVRMYYPHSRNRPSGQSLIEVTQPGPSHVRVAGLMHEPEGDAPLVMAGLMGMVKLFVRTGVNVASEVFKEYRSLMSRLGTLDKSIAVAIAHHANYKIHLLIEKHLRREGIRFPVPWLLSDFGNVSAASNLIAFLRQLPRIRLGEHVLFHGFGAGTYYDVLAVAMGA